jgi:hypothetical protein
MKKHLFLAKHQQEKRYTQMLRMYSSPINEQKKIGTEQSYHHSGDENKCNGTKGKA